MTQLHSLHAATLPTNPIDPARTASEADTPYVREPGYALRYRDARFSTGSGKGTHRREVRALERLLSHTALSEFPETATQGKPWLDLPAGAGRLSSLLGPTVVLADRDPAMVRASLDAPHQPATARQVAASGAQLPFADDSFAGCLCARLMQHIPHASERVAVLSELRRVTNGPLLVSFFDAHSLQHLRRRASRLVGKRRSGRTAVSRGRFAGDLQNAGWHPTAFAALRRGFSEQTFVLAV